MIDTGPRACRLRFSPLEPRALKWPLLDASSKAWLADDARMAMLRSTMRPDEVDAGAYDAIYFRGGHAVMWDFPDDQELQLLRRAIWEQGGIVSAVCHCYCALLNVRFGNGPLLVGDRAVTGSSWNEDVLAGMASRMPYNAEAEMKARGARYRKALIPFVLLVVADGRLVTGQNPFSAKATATTVAAML